VIDQRRSVSAIETLTRKKNGTRKKGLALVAFGLEVFGLSFIGLL
jgi:hypothetical protein